MTSIDISVDGLGEEISGAELGDKRLSDRAGKITKSLARVPSESFAKVFSSEAQLEGFYRFLRNPHISWKDLLEAHLSASASRACQEEEVLVVHDTTTFEFGPGVDREGLGWVSYKNKKSVFKSQGFFGHFALAVGCATDRAPLGIVGFEPFRRLDVPRKQQKKMNPEKESARWGQMVAATEKRLSSKTTAIHVMDREADDYPLLAQMQETGVHFVIRLCYDRRVKDENYYFISDVLEPQPWVCSRTVKLSSRKLPKGTSCRKRHPARKERIAKLGFKAARVEVKRPDKVPCRISKSLELNIVHVFEVETPEGVAPVEWKILTTEPIDTEVNILRIVDIYRARWLIEDYFNALKTGCRYEDRQLESYQTLLNALVLLIPVSWQLLLLRYLSRAKESEPAKHYFSQSELLLLMKRSDYKMSSEPTLKEALWAVASIGGHIRNNGDPGWLVLMRGFQELLKMDMGYQVAKEKCDQ
jgi:Transposase DNA-binding/Transposase DDE domain